MAPRGGAWACMGRASPAIVVATCWLAAPLALASGPDGREPLPTAPRLSAPASEDPGFRLADDRQPPARRPFESGTRTYTAQLIKHAGLPLEYLSAFQAVTPPTGDWLDQVSFEDLQRQTQRGVERATRRAAVEYLLDVANLDMLVDRSKRSAAFGGDAKRGADLGFNFGFYGGLPRVELHRGIARGMLRFVVNPLTGLDVSYGDRRLRVSAGSDGDEHRMQFRFGF